MRQTIAITFASLLTGAGCQSSDRPVIDVRGDAKVDMFVPFQVRSPEDMRTFLENRWPLDRIRKRSEDPGAILPFGSQNLVAASSTEWTIELYTLVPHEFDRIHWYGYVKDGKIIASSMNAERDGTHWVLEFIDLKNIDIKPPLSLPYLMEP